jgi:hypothetical protein
LFIAYVKSSGELNFEGNNSALFRACGAITNDEQKSLLEIYKEVKLFADPRIKTQEGLREKRRNNAKLGGIAKGLASAKPNAKILAEQKVSKRSAKSELELELELESKKDLKEKVSKDTKKCFGENGKVLLKDEEYQKLVAIFGETATKDKIQNLENYILSKGRKYASHYHTILNWERKNEPEKKGKVEIDNLFGEKE